MKKVLKLRKRHPSNLYRIGGLKITHIPTEFEISKEQQAILESKEGKAWIVEVEAPKVEAPKVEAPKVEAPKEPKQKIIKKD